MKGDCLQGKVHHLILPSHEPRAPQGFDFSELKTTSVGIVPNSAKQTVLKSKFDDTPAAAFILLRLYKLCGTSLTNQNLTLLSTSYNGSEQRHEGLSVLGYSLIAR